MKIRALFVLCCCTGLVACVNLKPTQHVVQRYVLGPAAATPVSERSGGALYVARPELPSYLAGNQMQYRAAGGELQSLAGVRWGEPLQEGVARALSELIAAQDERSNIRFYPWPQTAAPVTTLRIQLHQFAATADGCVLLAAYWQLEGEARAQGSYVAEGLRWTPGQAASLVAGLNAGLAGLAQEIAGQQKPIQQQPQQY